MATPVDVHVTHRSGNGDALHGQVPPFLSELLLGTPPFEKCTKRSCGRYRQDALFALYNSVIGRGPYISCVLYGIFMKEVDGWRIDTGMTRSTVGIA